MNGLRTRYPTIMDWARLLAASIVTALVASLVVATLTAWVLG
jgi:hypothetical protein